MTTVAEQQLGVWLYGRHVARLSSKRPGEVVCRYVEEALDTWPGGTPLLSCSLPLGPRPLKNAGLYFRGMLPEGQHLQAMAAAANVATYDTFGMLARFGRDGAGAAVIGLESPDDRPGSAVPFAPDTLPKSPAILLTFPPASTVSVPLPETPTVRLSLLVHLEPVPVTRWIPFEPERKPR